MRKPFFLVAILVFSTLHFSCNKSEQAVPVAEPEARDQSANTDKTKIVTYLIKSGEHYPTVNPTVFIRKNELNFYAGFDSSCIYTLDNTSNQNDVNKLYGFSDCGSHHLDNSARIGWRWSENALRIFAFVHNDGKMIIREMYTAQIGEKLKCRITCLPTAYEFEVNGSIVQVDRHCIGSYMRYKLYPYFGGDEVAPHDIRIKIYELP